MASISTDGNGNRTIQFVGEDRKRRSVRLGKVPMKNAEAVQRKIETILSAKLSHLPLDHETSEWIGSLPDTLTERLAAVGLIPPRERRTLPALKVFTDDYIAKRTDVKPQTKMIYKQSQRSLLEYFGATRQLPSITQGEMEDWQRWMIGKGLAENTHRKRAGVAKLFFNAAIKHKLLRDNPCTTLKSQLIVVEARQRIIRPEDIRRVLEFSDPEMRAVICLVRFAALRNPSETVKLRWSDVQWDSERLIVRSPKTEGQGKGSRIVPLVPEVREALDVLWDRLSEGASDLVFPRFANFKGVGMMLRKYLLAAYKRAGLEAPPKPWHNMRASCVNDWTELYPSHVVCSWAGHTEAVSQKHYRQTTPEHFQKAISQISRTAEPVQIPVQQTTVASRHESHGVPSDEGQATKISLKQDLAICRKSLPSRQVHPAGLEPATFGSVDRCSIQLS